MKKNKSVIYLTACCLLPLNPLLAADQPDQSMKNASYAFGVQLMKTLDNGGMTLDIAALAQGLKDVQSGKGSKFSRAEQNKAMAYFEAQRLVSAKRKAEEMHLAGREYQLNNKFQPGVVELLSGVQYQVLQPGAGRQPKLSDGVSLRFRVMDLTGKELFAIPEKAVAQKLLANNLIPGWRETVPLMQEGAKWRIVLSPDMAYGEMGAPDGSVPPFATIITDVELVSVIPAEEAIKALDKPTVTKTTVNTEEQ